LGLILNHDEQGQAEFFDNVAFLRDCGANMGTLRSSLIPDYLEFRARAFIESGKLDREDLKECLAYIKKYRELFMSLLCAIDSLELKSGTPEERYVLKYMRPGLDLHLGVLSSEWRLCMDAYMLRDPEELMRQLVQQ
jgi:hypothetical protein